MLESILCNSLSFFFFFLEGEQHELSKSADGSKSFWAVKCIQRMAINNRNLLRMQEREGAQRRAWGSRLTALRDRAQASELCWGLRAAQPGRTSSEPPLQLGRGWREGPGTVGSLHSCRSTGPGGPLPSLSLPIRRAFTRHLCTQTGASDSSVRVYRAELGAGESSAFRAQRDAFRPRLRDHQHPTLWGQFPHQ